MTRQLDTDVSLRSREAAPRNGATIAPAASLLLAELERSLEASLRALFSRDLEGLERATCEQIGLRRSLQILWPETLVPQNLVSQNLASQSLGSQSPVSQPSVSHSAGQDVRAQNRPAPELDPACAAGLRAAEWRVLYLGRVQAALLTRAQRSLRIVSHRLAGPAASYAAPAYARPAFEPADRPGKEENNKIKIEKDIEEEEKARPCRV